MQRVGLHNTSTQHTPTHQPTTHHFSLLRCCSHASRRWRNSGTCCTKWRTCPQPPHDPDHSTASQAAVHQHTPACVHQFRSCSRPSLSYGHGHQHHFPSFYHFDSHPHIGCGQVGQAHPASGYSVLVSRWPLYSCSVRAFLACNAPAFARRCGRGCGTPEDDGMKSLTYVTLELVRKVQRHPGHRRCAPPHDHLCPGWRPSVSPHFGALPRYNHVLKGSGHARFQQRHTHTHTHTQMESL